MTRCTTTQVSAPAPIILLPSDLSLHSTIDYLSSLFSCSPAVKKLFWDARNIVMNEIWTEIDNESPAKNSKAQFRAESSCYIQEPRPHNTGFLNICD